MNKSWINYKNIRVLGTEEVYSRSVRWDGLSEDSVSYRRRKSPLGASPPRVKWPVAQGNLRSVPLKKAGWKYSLSTQHRILHTNVFTVLLAAHRSRDKEASKPPKHNRSLITRNIQHRAMNEERFDEGGLAYYGGGWESHIYVARPIYMLRGVKGLQSLKWNPHMREAYEHHLEEGRNWRPGRIVSFRWICAYNADLSTNGFPTLPVLNSKQLEGIRSNRIQVIIILKSCRITYDLSINAGQNWLL